MTVARESSNEELEIAGRELVRVFLPELERLRQADAIRVKLQASKPAAHTDQQDTLTTLQEQLRGLIEIAPADRLATLEQLRGRYPQSSAIRVALADTLAILGEGDRALELYRSHRTEEGVLDRIVALLLTTGRPREALLELEDRTELSPRLAGLRGAALAALGDTVHARPLLEQAWKALDAAMDGKGEILVQQMLHGQPELIVGGLRDDQFGACVMCGLGGTLAEILDDAAFAVAPLSRADALALLERDPRVIRPANFRPGCPGRGWTTVTGAWGSATVFNLVGRVFLAAYDCPFRAMDRILAEERGLARVRLVDMHAEATSEKICMGRYLDGRVSAVVGTHTHVQTSDETILSGGTAYLTDLGMTGPKDSCLGRDLAAVTRTFLTGMPAEFKIGKHDVALEGALIEIEDATGRARRIERVREPVA
ncbi:MAG: hypothetical protein EOM10_14245 [Opitutae bacterium]|nr:hypothetical protein [Opitutae bacterium]